VSARRSFPGSSSAAGRQAAARAAGTRDPAAHVLSTSDLGEEQVRTALAYYAAYPEEIDARIAEEAELVERLLAGTS
jgi:hypothetical protein